MEFFSSFQFTFSDIVIKFGIWTNKAGGWFRLFVILGKDIQKCRFWKILAKKRIFCHAIIYKSVHLWFIKSPPPPQFSKY